MEIDDPSRLSIRHRLRFLAKDSVLYGGATALNKAFALITFPLLARHFSVSDFGVIDFFTVISTLLATFFIFGQDSAVARFFYEYENEDARRQIISQSFFLQIGFVLLALPLLWIAAGMWAENLSEAPKSELLLKIVLLQVPFQVLNNFSQILLKWTFSRIRYLIISLGTVVLNVTLLLFAILVLKIGVEGVFLIYLVVRISFGILGLTFIRTWLVIPNGFAFLRELVPFALPFGIISCIGAFVPALERSLVNSLLGANDLGLYAAGAKIAMLIALVNQAFYTAWGPFSLAIHRDPDAAHTYNYVLKAFTLGISVAVLLLSAIAQPAILLLASDRYAGAAIVVFPLSMALGIKGTVWITEIGITLSKKSFLNLYSFAAFLFVTAIAGYGLGVKYGLLGVALGVLFGQTARAFSGSWLAQHVYRLPWPFRPVLALMGVTIAIGVFGMWAGVEFGGTASRSIYTVGTLIVPIVGWFLLFTVKERQRLRSEFQAIRGRILWRSRN
ncbi:MAG: hypothetical protein SRB2_04486 [Desulfobacteraceae bacterium Eth-SRB2]|nr:MAG: hypothetical protein SRB2_04486 [Desulfobacteraceae bacterium Eth-SRB2]